MNSDNAVVGQQIRYFRNEYDNGKGISRPALAKALRVQPITVSRWEAATCRPTGEELEAIAVFFRASYLDFYRDPKTFKRDQTLKTLLAVASDLNQADLEDLRSYAESKRNRSAGTRPAGKHRRS